MSDDIVLVGLDVGTTTIKAIAFDPTGVEVAKATEPTPTTHRANGQSEHDPHHLWAACCAALQSVAAVIHDRGLRPVGLSCTSMAEAGVLLDSSGEPVHPIIPWFDFRTQPQIEWWQAHIGFDATAAISGVVPHPMFGMPKLMWIRDNDPAAYERGRAWLNLADYVDYRLCDVMATDYSLASRTLVLDLVKRTWSEYLLDAIGIAPSLLADLVPAGEKLGGLTPDAAQAIGLPPGLPIVRGGQDHVCAALAMGVTEPGVILDSIGTAEAFFMARRTPDMSGRLWPNELNQGVHVVPGFTYVMTGTGDGGGRIDSHRLELGLSFEDYQRAAEQPGPEQAMIESLAIDGQLLFEHMAEAADAQPVRHLATGGGTRIPRLMERKREIGGRPIEVPAVDEATCLGAALLAGAGTGVYSSIASAPAQLSG